MTNSQFNPALPLPIKFNINDGRFGNQLTLCIPVESVTHFMEHIQNLVNTKQSDGKVYDFAKKENIQTKCIYILTILYSCLCMDLFDSTYIRFCILLVMQMSWV